ncbi:chaperone protein dnaJ 2 [Purpureocillium lavendulum]|uniref:Chaperone protein dnaJ 2 n=1 Tax=Purpureocillium lavendulum TaxID=1247861 RepID=A0AB34FLM5_9HYPO|nr:chaperone protein dnaJ 2 [Purpureocillium lavendulum]
MSAQSESPADVESALRSKIFENLAVLFPNKNYTVSTASGADARYYAIVRTQDPASMAWDPAVALASVLHAANGCQPHVATLMVLEKLLQITQDEVDGLVSSCDNKQHVVAPPSDYCPSPASTLFVREDSPLFVPDDAPLYTE